jgi:excisionase family DNA binding protein
MWGWTMSKKMDEGVYTVAQLADFLGMNPATISRHAKKGEIPGFKVGRDWRFEKRRISEWMIEGEKKQKTGGKHALSR